MEPVWKLRAHASLDLATFLDRHDCRLPRTVRLLDGYCGTNEEDVLEADQILVLYKVERQKIIVGLDQLGQEICLQQNSKNKVHLLPLECHEYCTVKQLLTTKSSHFLVLDDIQCSIKIVSGSKLILTSRQGRISNLFKCQVSAQVLDQNGSREVLLPLHLTGMFLPLLDVKDYYVEDVLAKNELPVNIRFVSQTEQATTDHLSHLNAHSVTRQGNIRLTRKIDVEMVFAASFDKEFSLYTFPKTLNVSVGCDFKVSAETATKIKECMGLKKLDDLIKESFYFTANPVRRFNLRWPIIPLMSLPWCSHPRAKQFQTPEEEPTENRVLAKRDRLPSFHIRCSFLSSKKPISGEIQEEGDCENRETGDMPVICTSRSMEYINAFPSTSEATDEGVYANDEIVINAMKIPLRPPKSRPLSTAEDEGINARPNSPSQPVPKPRKRSDLMAKVGSQENKANKCASQVPQMKEEERNAAKGDGTDYAQRQIALCEDEVNEAFPELPPRPIFLLGAQNSSEELERLSSQEDKPPSLPLKKQQSKVFCPLREDTESREENQSQGLFYSAVDVADWKKVEENYELQAEEVKDHEVNEACPELPPRPIFLLGAQNSSEELERLSSQEDKPPSLPLKKQQSKVSCPLREDTESREENQSQGLFYSAVDVADWKKVEENYELQAEEVKDHEVNEACPELPPRPIFLLGAQNSSEELERLSSQEDKPPSLPLKKQQSKVSCPLREDTESKEENQSQGLFYSAVDVADWKKVEENYELQAEEVKDHGQIFREGDTANMVIDVVCELNGREDNQLLKGNNPEEKGRQQYPGMCPKQVDKENSDDENAYEEIEDFLETSRRKFPMKKQEKNKSAVQTSSKTSRCACSKSSIEFFTQRSQVSWNPSRNNDIWISSRREGDLVHFKDVQQFLRLKKQLATALAEVEDLKKQTQNSDPAEETRPWPASERKAGTSKNISTESKAVTKTKVIQDKNENILVSTKKFPKPFNRNAESGAEFGNDCGKKIAKKKEQPSPTPENIAHGNSRQNVPELEMSKNESYSIRR